MWRPADLHACVWKCWQSLQAKAALVRPGCKQLWHVICASSSHSFMQPCYIKHWVKACQSHKIQLLAKVSKFKQQSKPSCAEKLYITYLHIKLHFCWHVFAEPSRYWVINAHASWMCRDSDLHACVWKCWQPVQTKAELVRPWCKHADKWLQALRQKAVNGSTTNHNIQILSKV